jgi:hypothetical protein
MKIKRRTLVLLKLWVIRLFIISVVSGAWYFYFHTPTFIITNYEISGVDDAIIPDLTSRLQNLSHTYSLKVIPRGKILTYSSRAVIDTVRSVVPEAESISVHAGGTHTLKIVVTVLTPYLKLSDTQALTKEGIVFTTTHDLHGYPLITIASSSMMTIKRNGLIFNELATGDDDMTALLANVTDVSSKVSQVIFPVSTILIEDTGDVSCFNATGTSKVIFLKDVPSKIVWSNIVSAIDTEPLKTKLATEPSRLQYIDARFGNKIFYRFDDMTFQNGNVTGILGDHGTTTPQIIKTAPER